MRILISSNSPFAPTGYGQQTATLATRLMKMGHKPAIFAFWGLEGTKIDWNLSDGVIPIYPNNPRDWGIAHAYEFFQDWEADLFITLVDVYVQQGHNPAMPWAPWSPIDHNPIPPATTKTLLHSPGIIKPIAMTQYGVRQMKEVGIHDPYYVPHSIDTDMFQYAPEIQSILREMYGWQDKFVIGTVATNTAERKNWNKSFQAVGKFSRNHPGEIIWYCHTDAGSERGINLAALAEKEGLLKEVTKFPSHVQMLTGIDKPAMVKAYNTMDVFLLPSKGEGFGIPFIEAQACGVPVIMTKCTGHEELMGGGWFIEQLDPFWTQQGSYQFECSAEEILEKLEMAYKAKKDGSIEDEKLKAIKKAASYSDDKIYEEYWTPVLADIEKRLGEPKCREGVLEWRRMFIPRTCVPRKVLDIGCGATQPYRRCLEHLGEYVGIDVQEGPNVIQCDAGNLDRFSEGEFGFAWCSEVLEHVNDPERVIREAKRVSVHGVCLFCTPESGDFKMDPDHKVVQIEHAVIDEGIGLISW